MLLSEHRFEDRPDIFGDALVSFGIGMDAVGQVQIGDSGNPFQKKGDQSKTVFSSKVWENLAKFLGEKRAEIGRQKNPGKNDFHSFLLESDDNLLQISLCRVYGVSAEAVIGAKTKDDDTGVLGKDRIQPVQTLRRSIAADSRVDHSIIQSRGINSSLKLARIVLRRVDTEPGGQTVSKC